MPLALFVKDFQVSSSLVTDYPFWRLGVLRESGKCTGRGVEEGGEREENIEGSNL